MLQLLFIFLLNSALASEWTPMSPGGGGVFLNVKVCPTDTNVVYATSDVAGVLRSEDGGDIWDNVSKGLDQTYVQGLDFDPENPSNGLYVAASDGVYYSPDRGNSWTNIGRLGRTAGEKLSDGVLSDIRVVTNNNNTVIYVGTGEWRDDEHGTGQLWVSPDNGTNWTAYSIGMSDTSAAIHSIVVRQAQPSVVWISTGDGVYRSGNSGQTWSDKTGNLPHKEVRKMTCHPWYTHGTLAVLDAAGTNGTSGVYYRNPSTGSWGSLTGNLPLTNGSVQIQYQQLVVDSASFASSGSPQMMIVGSAVDRQGYYRTDDGGSTWTQIAVGTNVNYGWFAVPLNGRVLCYDEPSGNLFIGGDERILKSTDGDYFFDVTTVKSNDVTGRYRSLPGVSNSYYNVKDDTWTAAGESDNQVVRMITADPYNSSNLFISCADNVLFRSKDEGASCQQIKFTIDGTLVGGAFDVTFHPDTPNKLYALIAEGFGAEHGSGCIVTSDDGGDTWSLLAGTEADIGDLPGKEPHHLIFGPPVNGQRKMFVALYGGGIYESSDGGSNWSAVALQGLQVRKIAVNPYNENLLFAAVTGGAGNSNGIWKLTCSSGNWTSVRKVSNVDCWNVQAKDNNTYYAATDNGLYYTTTQGAWYKVKNLPSERMWGLYSDGSDVYVSVYGGDEPAIYHSDDNRSSWTEVTALDNPRSQWLTVITINGIDYLYAATGGTGVWRLRL